MWLRAQSSWLPLYKVRSVVASHRLGLDTVLQTRVLRSVLHPPLCGLFVRPSGLGISQIKLGFPLSRVFSFALSLSSP